MNTSKLALLSGVLLLTAFSSAADFYVKVTNYGPQPLSPVFFSAGNQNFNVFTVGEQASQGVKDIAEGGNTTAMLAIANASSADLGAFGVIPGGPIMPGQVRMSTFSANADTPYFSFVSMLGMTNDGWIGESVNSRGLMIFNGTTPTGFVFDVYGDRAWDAGTELNTQSSADVPGFGGSGNPADFDTRIRVHGGITAGIGDRWQDMPNWTRNTHLARVEVGAVPEPATMAALGLGLAALLRRRKQS